MGKMKMKLLLILMCLWLQRGPMVVGNVFINHAEHMFQIYGENATLYYEHPRKVADMSLIPGLIKDPDVVLAGLLYNQSGLFAAPPTEMNDIPYRYIRYTRTTKGLCFCCHATGVWNSKWKYWPQVKYHIDKGWLGNYTQCSDKFWLWGSHNASYQGNTTSSDLYPYFPQYSVNFTGQGSICSGWMIKDPNLWFLYDGLATNFHPGNFQCVGVGAFTFPVAVEVNHKVPHLASRRKRAALGGHCEDEIYLTNSVGSVGGGFIGFLSMGIYPGIVAEQNRKALFALTCRLEKTINATTHVLRSLQSEVEDLNQLTMTHRLVLDYLLARSGGFCKIVPKGQCQVKFHDLNKTIEDELGKLQSLVLDNTPTQDPWGKIWSWIPGEGWVHGILTALTIGGIVFLLFLSVIPCCLSLLRGMIARNVKHLTDPQILAIYRALPPVPDEPEEDDGYERMHREQVPVQEQAPLQEATVYSDVLSGVQAQESDESSL
ncbi:uncharacterized protein LOC144327677 [Podarcis muralis]